MEPLGRSQVWAYLRHLAKNHEITLISFEKSIDLDNASEVAKLREDCSKARIQWLPQRYHHRPRLAATAWDLWSMYRQARAVCSNGAVDLIHCRSYIPAFVALRLKKELDIPFIFDMRSFWPDEMVTAGRLRAGSWLYKAIKYLEDRCILRADAVVSLTEAAVEHLRSVPAYRNVRFEVIPTCADLECFSPGEFAINERNDKSRPFVLGCVGTVNSGWFHLDWLLAFYRALRTRRPDAILRVVTRDDPALVLAEANRQGVDARNIEIYAREHRQMPDEIRQMDSAAMFFISDFSKLGSCPTRMGEILGCGIPCVANPGIGDVDRLIQRFNVGVLVTSGDGKAIDQAVDALLAALADPELPARCRHAAEEWFSLERGVASYDRLYRELNGGALLQW